MARFAQSAWLLVVTTVLIAGCGGGSDQGGIGKVAAELKGLTCDPGTGVRVASLRQTLETNGIAVEAVSCGAYNYGRTAICGAPTDDLAFFAVRESDIARARSLGFFDAAQAPLAVDYGPCPAERLN